MDVMQFAGHVSAGEHHNDVTVCGPFTVRGRRGLSAELQLTNGYGLAVTMWDDQRNSRPDTSGRVAVMRRRSDGAWEEARTMTLEYVWNPDAAWTVEGVNLLLSALLRLDPVTP